MIQEKCKLNSSKIAINIASVNLVFQCNWMYMHYINHYHHQSLNVVLILSFHFAKTNDDHYLKKTCFEAKVK